jgi:hypothetical protein
MFLNNLMEQSLHWEADILSAAQDISLYLVQIFCPSASFSIKMNQVRTFTLLANVRLNISSFPLPLGSQVFFYLCSEYTILYAFLYFLDSINSAV